MAFGSGKKVPGEHIPLEGNDEALSDDEVEGEPRGRAGAKPAAQEASEGSEASHPKDFDRCGFLCSAVPL